jgi:hypothetical protein
MCASLAISRIIVLPSNAILDAEFQAFCVSVTKGLSSIFSPSTIKSWAEHLLPGYCLCFTGLTKDYPLSVG